MNTISAVVKEYNFFGIKFDFDNVAFSLGGFDVYWYGLIIAVGFLLALLFAFRNAKRFGVDKDRMMDVVIVGMIGAIVSARAYYLLFDGVPLSDYSGFSEKMKYIFGIHNGGIAIYGAVIGAFLFGGVTAKLRKIDVLSMFDIGALGFLIGQAVGRWGNFVNQEVYGHPTGSDWFGIGGTRIGDSLVHPLFLYESLWCLCAFLVLNHISRNRRFHGQIICGYMVLYSFGRFWLEGMRNTDFILMFGKISVSQLVSIGVLIAGIVLYIVLYRKNVKTNADYTEVFGSMYDDEATLDAGYALLGCGWDATDDELDSAYNALKAKYESMIAQTNAAADSNDDSDDDNDDDEPLSAREAKKAAAAAKKAELAEQERRADILSQDAPQADSDGMIEISDEELTVRAQAKLDELSNAYDYIKNNRRIAAEERGEYEQAEENEDTDIAGEPADSAEASGEDE